MRLTTLTAAAALMLFAAPAFAGQCPVDMQSIDVALASGADMTLSQDNKDEVAALRAKGEKQHKAGKHGKSVATLAKAKELLGIQ